MSENIKYDPIKMENAILSMKKVTDGKDIIINAATKVENASNKLSEILDISSLNATLSNIKGDLGKANISYGFLQDVKQNLDRVSYIEKIEELGFYVQNVEESSIAGYDKFLVDRNGVTGYLYIPTNDIPKDGLSLTVYLGGAGTNGSLKSIPNNGIGSLVENGYYINSAVFVPTNIWTPPNSNKSTPPDDKTDEKLFNAINDIVDLFKIDKKKVSLISHSRGGLQALRIVAKHPNYFSVCASYSPAMYKQFNGSWNKATDENGNKVPALSLSTDTAFIVYSESLPNSIYSTLDGYGLDVIGYYNERNGGLVHNDADMMLSKEFLTQVTGCRLGESNFENQNIAITHNQMKATSFFVRSYDDRGRPVYTLIKDMNTIINLSKDSNSYFIPIIENNNKEMI